MSALRHLLGVGQVHSLVSRHGPAQGDCFHFRGKKEAFPSGTCILVMICFNQSETIADLE
jgi:hypothetical protein